MQYSFDFICSLLWFCEYVCSNETTAKKYRGQPPFGCIKPGKQNGDFNYLHLNWWVSERRISSINTTEHLVDFSTVTPWLLPSTPCGFFWVFFCWSRMEPTHLLRFKRRSMKAWYFFGTCFALMLMVSCSKSKTRIGRLDLYRDRIVEIFELLVGECMPSDKKTASCDFSDSKGVKQKQPFFLSPSAWYVKGAPIEVQYVETVCKHYYQGAPIEFHMPYLLSKVGKKRSPWISWGLFDRELMLRLDGVVFWQQD